MFACMSVEGDPELLALPLRQMDLGNATNKVLKAIGCKTVGDVLVAQPAALAKAGLGGPALREIAKAAVDMGLTWSTREEISAAVPNDEPVTLDVPAAIAKLARPTFVLEGWTPPRGEAMPERCGSCGGVLELLAHLDLSAFPASMLPAVSVRAGRCNAPSCTQFLPKPGQWFVGVEASGGDRPAFRRENDYPSDGDLPKLPSERVSTMLSEHKYETIGYSPRVGGWPNTAHAIKPWPTCSTCQTSSVVAFQLPGDEQQELVFVCPKGCAKSGVYVLAVD